MLIAWESHTMYWCYSLLSNSSQMSTYPMFVFFFFIFENPLSPICSAQLLLSVALTRWCGQPALKIKATFSSSSSYQAPVGLQLGREPSILRLIIFFLKTHNTMCLPIAHVSLKFWKGQQWWAHQVLCGTHTMSLSCGMETWGGTASNNLSSAS